MTENEVKLWLNRAFYLEKKAKAFKECVEQARARAEGLSICYEGNDSSKSLGAENSKEKALLKLAEKIEKYRQVEDELSEISDEIELAISLLDNDELEAVLTHRYILCKTIEKTAEAMNYSERTIKNKQKQAVEKIKYILENNEIFKNSALNCLVLPS